MLCLWVTWGASIHKWSFLWLLDQHCERKKKRNLWSNRSRYLKCYFVNHVDKGGGEERVSLLQNLFFHTICLQHNLQVFFFSVSILVYLMWSGTLYLILCTDVSKTEAAQRCSRESERSKDRGLQLRQMWLQHLCLGKLQSDLPSVFRISGILEAEVVQIRHVLWGFKMLLLML